MKILHLTNKPIFPLVDGGCIAMYQFLKNLLSLGFEVKNLTIATSKHPFDIQHFPESLSQIILPEAVTIDTVVRGKEAFLSFFSKDSYNVSRFYDQTFAALIAEELKQANYGMVVLESLYLLPYLPVIRKNFKGKVILRAHNVEFRIWERLAQTETKTLKRIFLKKLAKDLKKYELAHLKKVDAIACISENDLKEFTSLGIRVPMRSIPVSMDLSSETSARYVPGDFFFLGSMNWKPNIEAVDSLLKIIFPQILEKMPHARLHLAGSFMPETLKNMQQEQVIIHGKVENIQEFMTQHGILLVPLKSGSGIRIKILEALALGVAVIGTPIAFEGIPVENEKHGIIVASEAQMADVAVQITQNEECVLKLGENGQKMVLSTYSKENISNQLIEFIKSI